jgi:Lon protease-like protein
VSDLVILPIFPLPDVTFFPHTFLPLHIFESRYRAMVTDALARDRRIAVVRLRPGYETRYEGKPETFSVAGAGEIVNCERLASGRFNMLVKGLWRVRIEGEVPSDTLYRVARARRLDDAPAAGDVSEVVTRIRSTCKRVLEALDRPVDVLDGALAAGQAAGAIADRVAAAFLPDPELRQSLLETLDVGDRLRRVSSALDDLANELTGER